jgi:hypothetical protein
MIYYSATLYNRNYGAGFVARLILVPGPAAVGAVKAPLAEQKQKKKLVP